MALERSDEPAADLLVGVVGNEEIKLSEIWSEGPVVLYFLRHFG